MTLWCTSWLLGPHRLLFSPLFTLSSHMSLLSVPLMCQPCSCLRPSHRLLPLPGMLFSQISRWLISYCLQVFIQMPFPRWDISRPPYLNYNLSALCPLCCFFFLHGTYHCLTYYLLSVSPLEEKLRAGIFDYFVHCHIPGVEQTFHWWMDGWKNGWTRMYFCV